MHEKPKGRRTGRRLVLIIGMTALATAAIGFGGLAAWVVTTQNNGSTFSAGTVHHSNTATAAGGGAVTCTDATSPLSCGVVWNKSNARPGDSTSGTVVITNTGSLDSTFALSAPAASTVAPAGNTICNDLTISVADAESPSVVLYSGPLSGAGGFDTHAAFALKTSNTSPVHINSATWSTTDTDTFTFTVTLSATPAQTSMGGTCTSAVKFTQTNI